MKHILLTISALFFFGIAFSTPGESFVSSFASVSSSSALYLLEPCNEHQQPLAGCCHEAASTGRTEAFHSRIIKVRRVMPMAAMLNGAAGVKPALSFYKVIPTVTAKIVKPAPTDLPVYLRNCVFLL